MECPSVLYDMSGVWAWCKKLQTHKVSVKEAHNDVLIDRPLRSVHKTLKRGLGCDGRVEACAARFDLQLKDIVGAGRAHNSENAHLGIQRVPHYSLP